MTVKYWLRKIRIVTTTTGVVVYFGVCSKERKVVMRTRKGVTLIELLVAVVILAMFCVIMIPGISRIAHRAKVAGCESNIQKIEDAMEKFKQENGSYPENLKIIAWDTTYFPAGPIVCPFTQKEYVKSPAEEGKVDLTEHDHGST